MARDTYTEFANTGFGRALTKNLGLPQPAKLRRHRPGRPLIEGPVVVLGSSEAASALADRLLSWGLDVRRHVGPKEKVAGVVACFDSASSPAALSSTVLEIGMLLKQLKPSGRVITVSRDPLGTADPAVRAARSAVQGLTRSTAHEMRAGGTANGIVLAEELDPSAPGVAGALRFLLSGRSAFVSGQFISVDSVNGALPGNWDRPLQGQVAVVTGAARGIGAAIARVLHRDGAALILVDIPAAGEQLAGVANEVSGTALQLDITAPEAGERILAHAKQHHGRLDIVVHNAGITRDKLLANMDESRWNSVIAVNIESQLRMNRAFLASELFNADARGAMGPRIISLASTSGIAGNRGQTNYAASKAGVMGMVSATAAQLAARHGTINAVAPGFIETEMTAKIPFATREVARRLNSLNQGGLPVDVAETIAFLASPQAGGTSGLTLRVCGQNLVGA
ncbi:3-oxoacyl-ACP reductase [Nesterenkonia sp. E16_7]|uniref:3-oxoacyl-ACP reductase n=1 Tax=unclassified Nesterenkonia TaxID=2629769 RepID=UPI001A918F85|nr:MULTISPECIES: 3-oxoacyl-ACP reductase [unclassified Nesterenkonia]MBO0595715.1 3-oxoacyl-ACP reductase [Nesterenkonia sp. E16_10]MBO0599708.1 3-oxoacyl-ACP reductase [Nesterenkonia sp. E16_7]